MKGYDPLEYIRNTYGVPATKGKVVSYKGQLGVITGASGPHVKVKLEGEKHADVYHPTDLNYNVQA